VAAKAKGKKKRGASPGVIPAVAPAMGLASDEGTVPDATDVANRLHSAAIHLLRRVRSEDQGLGLSPARLSALSVLVFGGERTIGQLASAEGVTPPSMTRLVAAMEAEGLVSRGPDTTDRRVVRVAATERGEKILRRGRKLRIDALRGVLAGVAPDDLAALSHAAAVLEEVLDQPAAPQTGNEDSARAEGTESR
jgi:DNA-binding MarR family transcriptional regulator